VDKDDPNPLLHKYSYDFTFADGTRIAGSSDDNIISVAVAGAVFDLHVSCSDDFANGYGSKDGPTAGQTPVQFPVSEFKIWKYKDVGAASCELKDICSGPNAATPKNPDNTKKPNKKKKKKSLREFDSSKI
jgi:hypothetical protein